MCWLTHASPFPGAFFLFFFGLWQSPPIPPPPSPSPPGLPMFLPSSSRSIRRGVHLLQVQQNRAGGRPKVRREPRTLGRGSGLRWASVGTVPKRRFLDSAKSHHLNHFFNLRLGFPYTFLNHFGYVSSFGPNLRHAENLLHIDSFWDCSKRNHVERTQISR